MNTATRIVILYIDASGEESSMEVEAVVVGQFAVHAALNSLRRPVDGLFRVVHVDSGRVLPIKIHDQAAAIELCQRMVGFDADAHYRQYGIPLPEDHPVTQEMRQVLLVWMDEYTGVWSQ